MPKEVKVDFSGYVTRNDVRCKDGLTIRGGAFQHNDKKVVPLVWQHLHNDPGNVLGKVYLENRDDGVYGYASFNGTDRARNAKELVAHGDVDHMSIYATDVKSRPNGDVIHGDIKEVSLVLSAANPGATIEHVSIAHGDGTYDDIDDEIVIHNFGLVDSFDGSGAVITIGSEDEVISHADDGGDDTDDGDDSGDETIAEIFDTLSEKQKQAVYAIVGAAVADNTQETEVKQSDIEEGDDDMKKNAFQTYGTDKKDNGGVLSHSDMVEFASKVFAEAQETGTFRGALMHAAQDYGIENIEILFPDAKSVTDRPDFIKRRTEWVSRVLNGTKHSPFSRIKTRFADITADEARARGYLKGGKKIEEVFPVMQRTTTPQTIYKKQKLDRDDIIDITDFDVVAWLRAEMRIMLDEEIGRAVLVGDGRLVTSPDKIKEDNIRPIWTDDPFYSYKLQLPAARTYDDLADAFLKTRLYYEGAGAPEAFVSPETVTDFLLQRDKEGRRMYKTEAELTTALRVSNVTEVPLFSGLTRTDSKTSKTYALDAIIVNLNDYTIGADKGGQITNFEDFDIDYNQFKYLIETRISGALTGYHSAVVIEHEVTSGGASGSGGETQTK